jgi:hypothetical protein
MNAGKRKKQERETYFSFKDLLERLRYFLEKDLLELAKIMTQVPTIEHFAMQGKNRNFTNY